ncbi:putative 3-isopropylmalate dehydratase, large subunit [Sulfitobacter noctilucicola]|uniref:3-isopropylmalate/(R)-2-methylmalate dehydratase large subunit n=1 Tax=Sulfitobacter noctilucicola TaxID=1342301 RepID=A0A7W6M9T4_9RHOB|nr:aconitase family protein [Sulfitobacter noctilucicola]KIN63389.1 putative 3-isopropylmalate dehydratase, large subunit [Sulfitobacter noctilucicola]MBB4175093.1 3-isopropylmalate/(R)-2-methylmalate dehydratase large subunit [Sulfitobacter noctilucicola]
MGYTIAEKILARVSENGAVRAGDEVLAKPDFVIAYDFPGYTDVIFKQMEEDFGIDKVAEPDRYALFIDHMVPAATTQEEELHQLTRDWGAKNKVPVYERKGIGHQVAAELGYATPGAFVVHFDGHISQLGTFGTLAIGVRRHLLEAFVKERIKFKVPETTRIDLTGTLQPGVTARDVFHHIVRVLGPRGCRGHVMELGGDTIDNMSLEGRQSINCLAMFTGAITALMNPDEKALTYMKERARLDIDPLFSDPDATYAARHEIDVSALEPIIVVPPSPADTRNLSEFAGTEVQVGYLGSCASGRVEDLEIAADVLEGHKVKDGFQLNVIPTSKEIMEVAAERGIISRLINAGAFISSSSCDYCFGRMGVMRAGQKAVSTGTLNVRGRMGSPDSEIYIVNAAAVAAAAIEGRIADPRPYLKG